MNEGSFEVIREYKKKYKGIRDPLQFLGVDCFSYNMVLTKDCIYKN